ncbi:General transcription factor II-I repeat domain-containing protein 2, partial [Habropoda laboriosa]
YALVIDESTDATDTAQLAIFIRGIDEEYNVIEEFTALVPLKPAMVGKKEGLIKLIEDNAIAAKKLHLMKYHCIVYQINLCAKALKMDNVMQIVIKVMNVIRAKGLIIPGVKAMNTDYGYIIYFPEVRWLSRGKMLQRFYDLLYEIKSFLISKRKSVPELDDKNWVTVLAFLVDLTFHLNELNVCKMKTHL